MKNVEFISVMVRVDGHIEASQYGWGAITLKRENRSYILDVVSSLSTIEDDCTIIGLKLEVDKETFDETYTKYDLTPEDLLADDLEATIFIGDEWTDEPHAMGLFVRFDDGLVKAINLKID